VFIPQDQGAEAAQILLVDDEKPIRDLLCKMLEGERYEIFAASNTQTPWRSAADPFVRFSCSSPISRCPGCPGTNWLTGARCFTRR